MIFQSNRCHHCVLHLDVAVVLREDVVSVLGQGGEMPGSLDLALVRGTI